MSFGKQNSEIYAIAGSHDPGPSTSFSLGLRWTPFIPRVTPTPIVLVLHGGDFSNGLMGPMGVAQDLCYAGLLAFPIEYRLAPPHAEMDTPPHPYPGQNTASMDGYQRGAYDLWDAIIAARAHPLGDGRVFCVGAGAGASLALIMAVATANPASEHPDRVVLLSGLYEFYNETHLGIDYPNDEINYHEAVTNYLAIADPPGGPWDTGALTDGSPLTGMAEGEMPPVFAMISSNDAGGVGTYDFPALIDAMIAIKMTEEPGPNAVANCFKLATVPVNSKVTGFRYWDKPIATGSTQKVSHAVATWLLTP